MAVSTAVTLTTEPADVQKRQSTMEFTLRDYTAPKLLDSAGAILALAAMSEKSAAESAPGTHAANPTNQPLISSDANVCNNLRH